MLKGIDISNYQKSINFDLIRPQVDFVIIKASEGVGYKDPSFETFRKKLKALNCPRGFYHFLQPFLKGNTAVNEANWFLSCIGNLEEGDILFLDFEVNVSGDVVQYCFDFLKTIENKLGYKPLLYINGSFSSKYDWTPVINNGNGLWLASWPNSVDLNYPPSTKWSVLSFWQYGSIILNGYASKLDGDVFYGNLQQLKKYGYINKIMETQLQKQIADMKAEDAIEDSDFQQQLKTANESFISLLNLQKQTLNENQALKVENSQYKQEIKTLNLRVSELEESVKKVISLSELKDRKISTLEIENKSLKEQQSAVLQNGVPVVVPTDILNQANVVNATFSDKKNIFLREIKKEAINFIIGTLGLLGALFIAGFENLNQTDSIIAGISAFGISSTMAKVIGKSFISQAVVYAQTYLGHLSPLDDPINTK